MEKKQTPRAIRTFAWASFFNDFGSDMIYPIWPLFVTTVLHADMAVLGLIDGLGEAIVSISQAISGYVSDRIQRRKVFVWLGYIFGLLSRLGYALASTWQQLIPLKILDRAGKMRGAPRDAIIADLSTDYNRGAHFGLLRTMDNLGAFCGIVVCIALVNFLSFRYLFFLAAMPSALSVLLIFFFIPERRVGQRSIFPGLRFKELDSSFQLVLWLSAIFALGAFSYSFLLLYAKAAGLPLVFIPVLYLIFTALAAFTSWPFGKLSDYLGRKWVMFFSYLLWILVCLDFILLNGWVALISGFILYGMHKGALETVQRAWVAELAPPAYRASALGSYQMVIGLCALPASLSAGWLWDHFNRQTPFMLSLALTLLAILLLLFVRPSAHSGEK